MKISFIDCPPTIVIENGAIDFSSGKQYGNQANVTCHDGYDLTGSGIITCTDQQEWNSDTLCVLKGKYELTCHFFHTISNVSS